MREYARRRTNILLSHLAVEVKRAAQSGDAGAIHDLRVAIRRLSRCLRVFAQFYPDGSWKKVRVELSDLLHLAGVVRDRDIALELLSEAGVAKPAAVVARMEQERRQAGHELLAAVRSWRDGGVAAKWRRQLIAGRRG